MAVGREAEREILATYRSCVEQGQPVPADVARAIDSLFAASQGRVYAACRKIVGNEEAARDLAQEALLTGYRKLAEFRAESALGTWLFGIAKMLSLNAIRRRSEVLSEDGLLEPGDPQQSALSRMRKTEKEEVFRAAAATLSSLEQEAIYLRYVEGLPQDRITELLGITQASGARGVLQRCRRVLARELRARLEALGHGTSFFRESLL